MESEELFSQTLIWVQNGQTITQTIKQLFVTRRRYNERLSKEQRAEIARARVEYLSFHNQEKKRKVYPRLFVETTAARKLAVLAHCKEQGIDVGRFCNAAIAEALRVAKANA